MTDDEIFRIRAQGVGPLISIPAPPRYSRDAVTVTATCTGVLELSARFAGEPPLVVREVPRQPNWRHTPVQYWSFGSSDDLRPRDGGPGYFFDPHDPASSRYSHPSDKKRKP
jgi:hypothetical protein